MRNTSNKLIERVKDPWSTAMSMRKRRTQNSRKNQIPRRVYNRHVKTRIKRMSLMSYKDQLIEVEHSVLRMRIHSSHAFISTS